MTHDDIEPRMAGTYHVTDDIGTYVNTDVRFIAMGGRLVDSDDAAAFDAAYDADQAGAC